jgi:hypothetical protein
VGLNLLKSLNLTNVYPNNKKNKKNNNKNKVKSKPLELYELAGKNLYCECTAQLTACLRDLIIAKITILNIDFISLSGT